MNKNLGILILTLFFSFIFLKISFASDFCSGFKSGYITGFKQAKRISYNPPAPYCPYKPYKKPGDPKSDYEFGYTLGFREGMSKGAR